jgi:hypothetical protein
MGPVVLQRVARHRRTTLRVIGRPAIIGAWRGHGCSSRWSLHSRSRRLGLRKSEWHLRQACQCRHQDKSSHCFPPLPKTKPQRHPTDMVPPARASCRLSFTAGGRRQVARPEGLEPPTPRFVVWCSIQLSYGRSGRRGRSGTGPPRQGPATEVHSGRASLAASALAGGGRRRYTRARPECSSAW